MKAPYFPKGSLELQARQLLADYGKKFSPFLGPPIDICSIAESFLELHLEYMDLEKDTARAFSAR
jgi:hypothetical protein